MKTHPLCLPCFRRQAEYATRLSTPDPLLHSTILKETDLYLSALTMDVSPPENAVGLYRLIAQRSGTHDPFAALKQQSNELALGLRPSVERTIRQGSDPLYRAILFAMAGNIIDYGAQQQFNLAATLANCLELRPVIDDYALLRQELSRAKTILYLADNCGEIVFDGLLIEQLPPSQVTMVVKGGPIINDATFADALSCGLDKKCRVVTNGTTCPGTPIDLCSREVQDLITSADVVISKGQGNFETLSEEKRVIYHLLTIKCPVVADHAAEVSGRPDRLAIGATVLMRLPV